MDTLFILSIVSPLLLPPPSPLPSLQHFLHARRSKSYESKLSDFNLLCALAKIIDSKLVYQICAALASKTKFDNALCSAIDTALLTNQLVEF